MAVSATVRQNVTVLGDTFAATSTQDADAAVSFNPDGGVAAAAIGALTTRTDNDTGTLTMNSGHGITTGARLDLYWDGGRRRGITVGTVATNSVPFDLGAGDNLPALSTAVTAVVPHTEAVTLTGANAVLIALNHDSADYAQFVFTTSGDVELAAFTVSPDTKSYVWFSDSGLTSPLSGAVAKVYLSHGDSDASATMQGHVLYD